MDTHKVGKESGSFASRRLREFQYMLPPVNLAEKYKNNNIAKNFGKNMSSTHKIDPLWKLLFPNSLSNEELQANLMKVSKN